MGFVVVLGSLVLTSILLVVGMLAGLVLFLMAPKQRRSALIAFAMIPFCVVTIPMAALIAVSLLYEALQKSDAALHEEVFGYRPTITESSMLFDEFGRGGEREIYMRANPNDEQRERLLAIPGLSASDMTLDAFIARGQAHGFTWWLTRDSHAQYGSTCQSADILEADGFEGWREFRIARCTDVDGAAPRPDTAIYVVARGRSEPS